MRTATASRLNTEVGYLLQRLSVAGAILQVGAHPDDEDVNLMDYVARQCGMRAVYWSATRGESGENPTGLYTGAALGLYRTMEATAMHDADGSEIMYGPFYDFGFSRFGEETLKYWGRENLVREIVRAIRTVQPAVVLSRWTNMTQDGQGHHLAINMVIEEAFDAAGDASRFQELTLPTWQPQKLYISAMRAAPTERAPFGQQVPNDERGGFVRANADCNDQEQRWIGPDSHPTQTLFTTLDPDTLYSSYTLRKSLVPTTRHAHNFFDGLDSTLTSLASYPGGLPILHAALEHIKTQTLAALNYYHVGHSSQAATSLLAGLRELRELRAQFITKASNDVIWALDRYLKRKEADVESAIAHCLGLRLECLSDRARVAPGQLFFVSARLWNQMGVNMDDAVFTLHTPPGWKITPGAASASHISTPHPYATYQVVVSEKANIATPYWLRKPHGPSAYNWDGMPWNGLPVGPRDVELSCRFSMDGQVLTLRETVVLREAFVGGFRELPIAVVPPIAIHPRMTKIFLSMSQQAQQLELAVVLRSNLDDVAGNLTLVAPPAWEVSTKRIDVVLEKSGDAHLETVLVSVPPHTAAGRYMLRYVLRCGGRDYDVSLNAVRLGVPGIPGLPDETNYVQEEFIAVDAEVGVQVIAAEFAP